MCTEEGCNHINYPLVGDGIGCNAARLYCVGCKAQSKELSYSVNLSSMPHALDLPTYMKHFSETQKCISNTNDLCVVQRENYMPKNNS